MTSIRTSDTSEDIGDVIKIYIAREGPSLSPGCPQALVRHTLSTGLMPGLSRNNLYRTRDAPIRKIEKNECIRRVYMSTSDLIRR
jgi:hypothetical protein